MRGRKRHGAALAAAALVILLGLQGCDQKTDTAPLQPVKLDDRLSGIYDYSCKACHVNDATGAPQSHDIAAWKPRLDQGETVLIDHMVNGFRGMPPLGQCIECSAGDLVTLMQYMASPAEEKPE